MSEQRCWVQQQKRQLPALGWWGEVATTFLLQSQKRTRVGNCPPPSFTCFQSRSVTSLFPPTLPSERNSQKYKEALPPPTSRSQGPSHLCYLAYQWEKIPQVERKNQSPTGNGKLVPL